METPIVDFIRSYQKKDGVRFHMPGHKGRPILGAEPWDLTEIHGADELYAPDGIIAKSEQNAASLFDSGATLYSTEGSSQCIRAMLSLALNTMPSGAPRIVWAARNVHKAFIYAAALLDISVLWLWPDACSSICSCPISAEALEDALAREAVKPAAVYITSPDYLGYTADLHALAAVCHKHNVLLLVDNAHGAYLRFLSPSRHPLDLGADMCCDSAHKTLPVLTGGAYLHISKRLPDAYFQRAKSALALFGSTSPSYLTLASLDACNKYLADGYALRLAACIEKTAQTKAVLRESGWHVEKNDPLRITLRGFDGCSGQSLAQHLRRHEIECEYADRDHLVLMVTPENNAEDFDRLISALGALHPLPVQIPSLPLCKAEQACSIRSALFAPSEVISTEHCVGRICAAPLVSCPPAIPIVSSGERITQEAAALLQYYGTMCIEVLADP